MAETNRVSSGGRILVDLHHADLYFSYALMLEKRLGFQIYVPTGMDWFHQEYWIHERAVHGDSVAKQYLEPYSTDIDCGDHWERPAFAHPDYMMKMVTLEQVREMKPEIVLCSLVHNESGYRRLATELNAKFGIQVGNIMTPNNFDVADFSLMSTTFTKEPSCPFVQYRQEFSLDDFRYEYPPKTNVAGSWVHSMYWTGWRSTYDEIALAVPKLSWEYYGHQEKDNPYWKASLSPCSAVAESMRDARVGIHLKSHGDGFGHIVHNLFATGKPVVGTTTYYQNQIAGPLFVDMVNSIDVQTHPIEEVIQWVNRLATDDEFHRQVSQSSYDRFKQVVNFGEDAEKVRQLLERVLS